PAGSSYGARPPLRRRTIRDPGARGVAAAPGGVRGLDRAGIGDPGRDRAFGARDRGCCRWRVRVPSGPGRRTLEILLLTAKMGSDEPDVRIRRHEVYPTAAARELMLLLRISPEIDIVGDVTV